jgi:sugar lactone lactonase YvrE
MRPLPYLAALLLAGQMVSSSGKLPLDELPAALRAQAADVQAAWDHYPDNACVLYYVAAIYAQAGHPREAMDILRRMAGTHAGLDPRLRDGFQSLAGDPEFLRLKEEIRRANPPVKKAQPAFVISERDLMPEGIAWSARRERFYLGSAKRKIIVVDRAGRVEDFVPPGGGGLGFVLGLRVDDERGELWAVSEQLSPQPGLVRGIFRYRLSDGKLLAKYPAAPEGADLVNDLVVAPDGSVYATATNSGSLLRIPPGGAKLEIFLPPHSLPDPNGMTVSQDGRFLFVAGWYGITRVDLKSKAALLLKGEAQISVGCIDGLYEYAGDLIGIQNCVHDTGRVLRLHLNPERDTIVSARVLESYNPLFETITTGAIAGHDFYFAANTQIHKMAKDGSIPPGVGFNPIQVLRLPLDRSPARP